MPDQSIVHTKRQLGRAKTIAQAALAAPATEQLVLKVLAPDMVAECTSYEAADAAVRGAEVVAEKELREAMQAMAPVTKAFDEVRVAVAAKTLVQFQAASSFTTPDDFLHAAEELESVLEQHQAEAWVAPVLAMFAPLIDSAVKEQSEASDAVKALQKAQLSREQADGKMRPVLVRFRRAVRATFGKSAREYLELRDRRGRVTDDEEPVPEVAAPTVGSPASPNPAAGR
jgi:hypothetical protein